MKPMVNKGSTMKVGGALGRRGFTALASAVIVIGLAAPASLFAQAADGNITGTVLDASGAAVPGALIAARNVATGVQSSTKTDTSGSYRINNLLVGAYAVSASATGFTATTLNQVQVELNKTTTLNITLTVGTVTTAVEVTDSSVLIDTTTAQVSNTYTSQMASQLPAASNPFSGVLNLSLLGAGVTSAGGFGTATGPSVGGQRPRNNNYTVEGVDNNRKDVTGPVVSIPGDAVSEFTILQNQFSAEFGHSSGGQFNTVIRGGTNEVHGVVYDYLENRDLNALDQAAKRQGTFTQPRYDQNHLGGAIGGPIRKNKLFYYGLYEYNPTGQASVPSSAVYAPTAAGYATLATLPGVSQTNLSILKQYAPPTDAQVKTVPVGGVNIPVGILPIVAPNFANIYTWLVSVDYNMSDKDQFRIRYVDNKTSEIDTNNVTLPVFFYPRPTTQHLASVSEFHNFNPSLTNEFRLAYNRYNDNIGIPNFQFPGLDVFPNIQMATDLNLQIGPDANAPQATVQSTEQLVDNLSWIKGKHEIKFGGDVRVLKAASTFIQRVRGDYQYSSLSRYLLDLVPDVLAERNVGGKPYSGDDYLALLLWQRQLEDQSQSDAQSRAAVRIHERSPVDEGIRAQQRRQRSRRAHVRRAAAAEEELRAARRIRLLAGHQGHHLDPRRLRNRLRPDLRQRRHQRPPAAGDLHSGLGRERHARLPGARRDSAHRGRGKPDRRGPARRHFVLPGQPAVRLFDQLEPRDPARVPQGLHAGRPLSRQSRRAFAVPAAAQSQFDRHANAQPADLPASADAVARSTPCR